LSDGFLSAVGRGLYVTFGAALDNLLPSFDFQVEESHDSNRPVPGLSFGISIAP